MIRAVFDSNVLISAFLSRHNPQGLAGELLRFVVAGAVRLHLSDEIVDEVIEILLTSERLQKTYRYTAGQVGQYRADLLTLATIHDDPPAMPGAVPRDADDDKIVACAIAASAEFIVSRDDDLLSLGDHHGITISRPEEFVHLVRGQFGGVPQPRSTGEKDE